MSAFLFGTRERPLFGYYHAPAAVDRGSVLVCQPWGIEYQYAHRTMRFLARRLASQGWHVLRFDYSGTGDSWGDTTDADLQVWLDDVRQAANELRMIGGLETLSLVGLRLGGTVAAMAASALGALHKLVLWDPILDGPAWIEELADKSRTTPSDRSTHDDAGTVELGRHTVSEIFSRQLADLRALELDGCTARKLLLWTQDRALAEGWSSDEVAGLDVERVLQPSPWIEDIALGSGQIPVEAVSTIADWLEAR